MTIPPSPRLPVPPSRSICAILCALVLVSSTLLAGQPDAYPIQQDVVYGKAGGVELKLDLAVPPATAGDGPFPLLVLIHGGGWCGGTKLSYHNAIREYAKKNYVAATVEYRFAPKFKFPAQVEDVKCAVRYLRAHAKELKIDPKKVAALGDSAGGHLSLMLGLMDSKDGLEGDGGNPEQSSKVQAVINYYGPTDFTVGSAAWNPMVIGLVTNFLGTTDEKAPIVAQSSPITYINAGDPPILTFHGTADLIVPLDQAKRLHEALKKAGVTERLEIIEKGGHGFRGPDFQRTFQISTEFLEQVFSEKK
ncbi:MAG TPA: alpha/beta hydrolase [Planctomycetota bacterium]